MSKNILKNIDIEKAVELAGLVAYQPGQIVNGISVFFIGIPASAKSIRIPRRVIPAQ